MSMGTVTVTHRSPITGRTHVEEEGHSTGLIWGTDPDTAARLAEGYRAHGYVAAVVPVEGLKVENLPFNGSLVAVES